VVTPLSPGAVATAHIAALSCRTSAQPRQPPCYVLQPSFHSRRNPEPTCTRQVCFNVQNSPCRRGEDPEADAVEKALLRTARRGVVQLFNAVAKAQKQAADAQAPGARAKVVLCMPLCPMLGKCVGLQSGEVGQDGISQIWVPRA
jgi:Rrp15p